MKKLYFTFYWYFLICIFIYLLNYIYRYFDKFWTNNLLNFCLAEFLYLNIVIHLFSYKNNCIFVLYEILRLLDRNQRCFQLYLKLYIPKETCIKIRCPLFDVRDAHHILVFTARVIDTRNLKTPVFIIHILFFNKLIGKKNKNFDI